MAHYHLGDTFRWFIARVIDIKDPEKMGRVQIRVIHEQTGELGKKVDQYGFLNEELLWAYPISAIQSASLSWKKVVELEKFETPDWVDAVGLSPTGIAVGTYAFGFYLDGYEQNIPMIFGTYHKQSIFPEPGTKIEEMLQDAPPEEDYKYHDVSALAKGYFEDPITEEGGPGQTLPKEPYEYSKLWRDETDDPLKISTVDEMPTAYNTEYPYNLTYTTKSGHAIELDDTPGHERMHMWHRSGTYEEISNAPSNPGIDADRGKVENVYPETGPSGWNYTTAGGVAEPDWKGRRARKTMDSFFETVVKDKNELLQRDHNVSIANTQTVKIGNTYHWTVGYQDPPPNRINDDGSTEYDGGAIDKYNLYLDVANNVTLTAGNNRVVQVGYEIEKERRLEKDVDTWNYFRDVYNTSILVSENNHLLSVGYNKDTERKIDRSNFPITKNYYRDVGNNTIQTTENNMAVSVGYSKDEERGLSDTDKSTYYRDVKNNTHIRTNNNYNLNVGLNKDQEKKLADDDYGNYYVNVAGSEKHHIGFDQVNLVNGAHTTQAYDVSLKAQAAMSISSGAGMWIAAGNGIKVASDVTLISGTSGNGLEEVEYKNLTARLTAKNGTTGFFTTADGKTVFVTAGIITDIS